MSQDIYSTHLVKNLISGFLRSVCSAVMVEFGCILVIVKYGCILVARHSLAFLRHYCIAD